MCKTKVFVVCGKLLAMKLKKDQIMQFFFFILTFGEGCVDRKGNSGNTLAKQTK